LIDPNAVGIAAALGSAASWSVGALLFGRLGESLSSFAMTLVKGALSVVLLGAMTLLMRGYSDIGTQAYSYLALSGLLGIAVSDTFFFSALKELGPRALVLLATLGQVVTVLLAVVFLGERLPVWGWVGIALIVSGIATGVFPEKTREGKSSLRGIVYGLLSVLSMSVSVILTKKGLDGVSTVYATLIRMLAGTLGMLLIGILTLRLKTWVSPFNDRSLMARFLVAVFVITIGGFWLAVVAFKYTSVAIASSLISTEPVFILPLSVVFLKEKLTTRAVAGAVIAVAGVIALCTIGAAPG
jgi:drug/metabolite transporter (DMT)-like permease